MNTEELNQIIDNLIKFTENLETIFRIIFIIIVILIIAVIATSINTKKTANKIDLLNRQMDYLIQLEERKQGIDSNSGFENRN